ncbi:MAG: resuscitation-promoting factor RpfA [Actinomycetota bacterium]|jgi:hypothetical protein
MSLRGSLDTFALPDVLALLATTAKSGELHVTGSSGGGRLWVEAGQVTGAEAAGTTAVVDVLVHLLRLDEGDFAFHADRAAPSPSTEAPVEVAVALEQADARLTEWREVEALLPSPTTVLTLAPTSSGTVRLSKDQWAAVAAVGDGRTVTELVDQLGGDELVRWRLLASLVEAGLAEVGASVTVAPVRRTEVAEQLSTLTVEALAEAHAEDDPALEDSSTEAVESGISDKTDDNAAVEDEPEEAAPVPTGAETVDAGEGVSRGTLLKFLSSVRQ